MFHRKCFGRFDMERTTCALLRQSIFYIVYSPNSVICDKITREAMKVSKGTGIGKTGFYEEYFVSNKINYIHF